LKSSRDISTTKPTTLFKKYQKFQKVFYLNKRQEHLKLEIHAMAVHVAMLEAQRRKTLFAHALFS